MKESSGLNGIVKLAILTFYEEIYYPKNGHHVILIIFIKTMPLSAKLIEYRPILFVNSVTDLKIVGFSFEPKRGLSPFLNLFGKHLQIQLFGKVADMPHYVL